MRLFVICQIIPFPIAILKYFTLSRLFTFGVLLKISYFGNSQHIPLLIIKGTHEILQDQARTEFNSNTVR